MTTTGLSTRATCRAPTALIAVVRNRLRQDLRGRYSDCSVNYPHGAGRSLLGAT